MKTSCLLFLLFIVGDCVQLVKGPFWGEYWRVTSVNSNSTYDIEQEPYVIRQVRGSFLIAAKDEFCEEK